MFSMSKYLCFLVGLFCRLVSWPKTLPKQFKSKSFSAGHKFSVAINWATNEERLTISLVTKVFKFEQAFKRVEIPIC